MLAVTMGVHSLYIINKAGSLIYQRDFIPRQAGQPLNSNDYLRLAGLFHGMHTIARSVAPTKSGGIVQLEGDHMQLRCFQALTGTKFFAIADLASPQAQLESFLAEVYHLYTDYCLKNPFYDLEQPIHNNCEKYGNNTRQDKTRQQTKSDKILSGLIPTFYFPLLYFTILYFFAILHCNFIVPFGL